MLRESMKYHVNCLSNSRIYLFLDLLTRFPRDQKAYEKAIAALKPGDVATIFTPDDKHFDMAMACIKRGVHVLVRVAVPCVPPSTTNT